MDKKILILLSVVGLYLIIGLIWYNPTIISLVDIGDNVKNEIVENVFIWNGHYALVRFEDVNPTTNIVTLRDCMDLLKVEDVPFSIALIPVYKDPVKNITVYLHERPELVKLIKESGTTIVLHGCTHQYDGETGVDFEFWDETIFGPIEQNNTEYAIQKIELALNELKECGISTEIWETPHYTSDNETKQVVSKYFSTTYEGETDKLVINGYGQIVVPTNLYYVKGGQEQQSINQILSGAKNISSNSDNITVASFFYHPYLGSEYLYTIVRGFREQGFVFVSPNEYIDECLIYLDNRA